MKYNTGKWRVKILKNNVALFVSEANVKGHLILMQNYSRDQGRRDSRGHFSVTILKKCLSTSVC